MRFANLVGGVKSLPSYRTPLPLAPFIPPTGEMGNCSASTGDVDLTLKVKKGILDPTCFEEHRALGQGGFGTVFAVTKK